MVEINPDPYKDGDPLGPKGRMTAIFNSLSDLKAAVVELRTAGYTGKDAAVFVGPEGSKQFDSDGEIRHIEGLKAFQNAVCDEEEMFDEFEKALASGGAVVAVAVDNELKKQPVATLLKSHNATNINYWGEWQNEGLG